MIFDLQNTRTVSSIDKFIPMNFQLMFLGNRFGLDLTNLIKLHLEN